MIAFPSISFDDFLAQADTCDLVLWGGTSFDSTGIEILSDSVYSHTTMVITDPTSGAKCLLQAAPEALGPDPLAGGASHAGVQAADLRTMMLTLGTYGDMPTWIPYSSTDRSDPSFVQAVWTLAKSLDGIAFPSVPLGMARLLIEGRYEGIEKTSPLFCSGLAALIYKRLGVIDPHRPCNAYWPKDFSSRYPGYLKMLKGSFGTDTTVELPTEAKPKH